MQLKKETKLAGCYIKRYKNCKSDSMIEEGTG
jgi:hypothetical protein